MPIESIAIFCIALWLFQYEKVSKDRGKKKYYDVVEWRNLSGHLSVNIVVKFYFELFDL